MKRLLTTALLLTGCAPEPQPTPTTPAQVSHARAVSCADSVALAVAATEVRCAEVLDCRNVDRHPQTCSTDCKYHALEVAFHPLREPPFASYMPPSEPHDVDAWRPSDEEDAP